MTTIIVYAGCPSLSCKSSLRPDIEGEVIAKLQKFPLNWFGGGGEEGGCVIYQPDSQNKIPIGFFLLAASAVPALCFDSVLQK